MGGDSLMSDEEWHDVDELFDPTNMKAVAGITLNESLRVDEDGTTQCLIMELLVHPVTPSGAVDPSVVENLNLMWRKDDIITSAKHILDAAGIQHG
jgi:hypothetical protein